MPANVVTFTFDESTWKAGLYVAGGAMMGGAIKAINRTMFEVQAAEKKEAAQTFTKKTARGERFLAGRGAFLFNPATPEDPQAQLFPSVARGKRPFKRMELLEPHERLDELTPDKRRLEVGGFLAVPLGAAAESRKRSGRVLSRYQFRSILRRSKTKRRAGRGSSRKVEAYIREKGSHGVVLYRPEPGAEPEPLYALVRKARLTKRFDFFGAFQREAKRWLPIKARQEVEKAARKVKVSNAPFRKAARLASGPSSSALVRTVWSGGTSW